MSSRRIELDELYDWAEEFGVGVPVALAMLSLALMYGLRDALNLGGKYSKVGIAALFLGVGISAWLSGYLYERLDTTGE